MNIIVVGGGVSGVISSIIAGGSNKITILERNDKLLKKLLLTGNGRCNYLNETYSKDKYYSMDIDIVDKIISSNNIELVREFFDTLGIIPNIKNGYYYPYSNQAITIKNILEHELFNKNVEVVYNTLVEEIKKENNKFIIKTNNGIYTSDKLVLASGGCSYPKTGSDGMGYKFLEKFGHTIIEPVPSLVQLISDFKYSKDWDGVRSNVEVELFENKKYISKEKGEIQLTSYGLSGICIFNLSNYISRGLLDNKNYCIHINFVPFIETLVTPWMDSYSKKCSKRTIKELLEGFLNYKVVLVILKVSNIDMNKKYKDLTKNEKFILCKNLRCFKINIINTKGFESAQITNGGVKLSEINIDTFESLKVKDLYITGELLDMNGDCGGYNLTTCWISGIKAGKSIGGISD